MVRPTMVRGILDQTIDRVDTTTVPDTTILDTHDSLGGTPRRLWREYPDLVTWSVGDLVQIVSPSAYLYYDNTKVKKLADGTQYYRLEAPFAHVVADAVEGSARAVPILLHE